MLWKEPRAEETGEVLRKKLNCKCKVSKSYAIK